MSLFVDSRPQGRQPRCVPMHIKRLLADNSPSYSFEYFPPRTEKACEELYSTIRELEKENPSFVSVTYGAGGTTRQLTHDLVVRIKETTSTPPVPHLTCVGHTDAEISTILQRYAEAGVSNILALRGDPPKGVGDYNHAQDAFVNAADLVRKIKNFEGHPATEGFGIGVAGFPEGHPATPNRLKEMDYLKEKVDAGADYICTQLFFDNGAFHDFRERCELAGIKVPIIAGVMPILTKSSMMRMADLSGGTNFPASLLKRLNAAGDDAGSVESAGIDFAFEQCQDLVENQVAGIHFYTLNKSAATLEILRRLRTA